RRGTAVTFTIRVAKRTIAFVDDHDDLTDRANHVENLFEISLSRTNPLRPEILQFDRRQSTLFCERFSNERLARTHRTSEQNAHRHTTRASIANALSDDQQVFLHFFHA